MVNGESDGGGIGGKRRVPSFPSLPFPCLALPGLPALSWLGFDLERGKEQGGRGCGCTVHATGAMQCNLRMDGLLYIGWLQVLLAALILFGGQQAGTHTHFLTHNATAGTRARWWEEEEDEEQQGLQAREEGMNDRTGNGHWALGIHTEPRRPQHGDFGKGKVRARVVQAAAGLLLCRIRRADKEVSCISCPYWRLLLPVKGLPHLSRLPFHGTLHRLRSHSHSATSAHSTRVIYVLYAVLYAASLRYNTQVPRPSTHPAGRNSLKELPGWDPGKDQNCPVLAALPKWTLLMGPGNGVMGR